MRLEEYDRIARAFRRRHEVDLRRDRREFRKEAPECSSAARLKGCFIVIGVLLFSLAAQWRAGIICCPGGPRMWFDLVGVDRQPIDVPASLAMVDGSESGPPSNLGRAGSGRYALIDSTGIGLPCVNCEYEIRARGFQPYRFRAGDYCVSVPHDGYCSMVEVQATLIREDTAAEEEPVDTTGWRISCEQALIDAKWKLAKLVPAFRHARVDERHLQPVTYIPDGPRKLPRIDTWIDFGLSLNTQGHREAYSALIFSGTGTFSFDWEPYELEECANDKICDDREERKAAPGVSTFLSSSPRYREQFTAIFKPALDRCVEMGRTRQQTETHLLDDKRREKAVDACLPGESYPEGTQVKLSWEVGLDGRVRFTEVEISGAAAEEIRRVEDCLQAKAKHWRMPKPRDGMPQTDGFVTTYE